MIIVGTGNQAFEYVKILAHIGVPTTVIGNTPRGCDRFRDRLQAAGLRAEVLPGGLQSNMIPTESMIIAVPVSELYSVATIAVLGITGLKYLLIEKPGSLYSIQMRSIVKASESAGVGVWIAYNRRFYLTVSVAQSLVQKEGLKRLEFCFGEPMYEVMHSHHPDWVKSRWLIANSSHLIDAALWISGQEIDQVEVGKGTNGSYFSGRFPTAKGEVLYHTNWEKDRRWKIMIETDAGNVYHLGPLEILTGNETEVTERSEFKLGMLDMVRSFLGDQENLPSAQEQLRRLLLYYKMGGYQE